MARAVSLITPAYPNAVRVLASAPDRISDLRVPEHVHDGPRGHTLGEQERGASMPQVMRAGARPGQPSAVTRPIAGSRSVARSASRQTTRTPARAPARRRPSARRSASCRFFCSSRSRRELGKHDGSPRAVGLRRGDLELAVRTLHGPQDVKLPRSEVDVISAQGQQLAAPKAGGQRKDAQSFEPLAVDDFEQALSLRQV